MIYALIALGAFCLVTLVLVLKYGDKTKRVKARKTPCPLCDAPELDVDKDGSFDCGACGVNAELMAVAPRDVMEIHYRWRKMTLVDVAGAGALVDELSASRSELRETLTTLLAASDAAARAGKVDDVRSTLDQGRRALEAVIVSEGKAAMSAHASAVPSAAGADGAPTAAATQ